MIRYSDDLGSPGDNTGPAELLAGKGAAAHRAPQVVARPHLLEQLALPRISDRDARLRAAVTRDVRALGELVAPDAALSDEHDASTATTDVLDNCLGAAVVGRE